MGSHFSHGPCVTIKAELPDLRYARSTIGFECQPEQPGDEVVEFPACARIGEFGTLGTTLYLFLRTARAHLAPTSLSGNRLSSPGWKLRLDAFSIMRELGQTYGHPPHIDRMPNCLIVADHFDNRLYCQFKLHP